MNNGKEYIEKIATAYENVKACENEPNTATPPVDVPRIVRLLGALRRYDKVTMYNGDGFPYTDLEQKKDGRLVKWRDVEAIIFQANNSFVEFALENGVEFEDLGEKK